MAGIIVGVGFLTAVDLLIDCSYVLIEPIVDHQFPAPTSPGSQTINIYDPSIYVGCQLVAGANTANIEVVVVTAVTGSSFTATFANSHATGDSLVSATFPVRQPTDPFFTQPEMLAYLSTAVNDFLLACPLIYNIGYVTVAPTEQNAALPSDCMVPMRIAVANYPLRETSQARLDIYNYRWQQEAPAQPYCYFRDKVPQQNFGVWPRANNTVNAEIVYQQRGPQTMGLADGFLIPDPFLYIVKAHVLEFALSKDGDQRSPGLAQFWAGRYQMGCKIANVFLAAVMDPGLQMEQQS